MAKLFVSNLPLNYTKTDIKQIFTAFGPLKSIKQYITPKKQESNIQSAFIEYVNNDDAVVAVKSLRNKKFYDRYLIMQRAYERYNKLYVGNLDDKITAEDLHSYFSDYGRIAAVQREKENDYAFVVFEDAKVAEMLVNNHGVKKIGGNSRPVILKRAESKTESRKRQIPYNRSVCVKNMPTTTTEDLNAFFEDCGCVERIQMGSKKAFVVFRNELGALKAMKYKNKKEFNGRRLAVEIFTDAKKCV
ncbi:Polyadenylate-binding protein (RRM superfamily) [Trachipleistophora hominis]|uniref:Polyadenylate-binding protein (RRM superfamily) n=1 Tax=Trachipleistophora hominis TaxID=72359 RepID=L7JTV1_TRAHO|nr:Polyadenylate-binding protein (RRM superfamily) [Trachipleistophora hominis]